VRETYVNIGRRKQMRRTARNRVLFVIISAVVIFALSLTLGNYLRAKVSALPPRADLPDDLLTGQLPADTSDASEISIMASYLPLTDLTDSAAIESLVESLTLGSREAVSLCLRDRAGEVHFRSTVAQNLTGGTPAELDLSLLLPALRNAGIYTSAVFGVTSFSAGDTAAYDLQHAFEISLAGEIGAAGVDELLLVGIPISVDTLDAVTAYITEIDAQLPDTVQLAVAVPPELVGAASGTVLCKQLSMHTDTIALDLRGLTPAKGQTFPDAAEALFADTSLYFSKYNMRVLLPQTDSTEFAELRQILELNGIRNWQVIN